ncbi:DUF6191 domain-containing protein [Streptomyces sp. NPDC058308]|uniref:DUF6191 domain-containing protein n=1 Tax=Streptomyces sp. NPDC058308 TaxID=3346440 RepID=UPI0036E68421
MFNAIEALFAPGRKHTDDEQKRLELARVDLADGDPGRGPIDLTSGKVVVRPPVPTPRTDASADADDSSGPDPSPGPDASPAPDAAADGAEVARPGGPGS